MNVTKEQFTAEIMRRKEARAAERDALKDSVSCVEKKEENRIDGEYNDYRTARKYRGKCHTCKGFEC